jgi:lysophospholipase L1-like esterase
VLLALLVLAAPAAAKPRPLYVSLGDSWAAGVQPLGANQADIETKQGYSDFLAASARRLFPGLRLVNLGCGGETTVTMITGRPKCNEEVRPYGTTKPVKAQLPYAVHYLRAHRGRVALVTVILGGDDVQECARQGDLGAILTCVNQGLEGIKRHLPTVVKALRKAVGPKTIIVASTYADVVLGQYVLSPQQGPSLAQASVSVFRTQLNPLLKKIYAKQRIGFVDTTKAFGTYVSFSQTTTLAPYGTVPVAVANLCKLAWYCAPRASGPDIHLRPAGYRKVAGLILRAVKAARG